MSHTTFRPSGGFEIAFFGLPLAAYLLARDGHRLAFAVFPAFDPLLGRRRLHALIGRERVIEANSFGEHLEQAVEERFAHANCDLLVSWFWPRRIPAPWLERARLGAIGAHPSLLPRHRGPNPYFWAIDQGDALTGVSIHRLTAAYDEGAILAREQLATGERNAWQLARALDRLSLRLLRETIALLARGERIEEIPQDERAATWAPEPTGAELRVDWSWPSERVLRRIRALSPVPGLALEIRGVRLFVTAAAVAPDYISSLLPGEGATMGRPPRELILRTGNGAIVVQQAILATDAEPASGPPLNAHEVAALVEAARVIDCLPPEGNG